MDVNSLSKAVWDPWYALVWLVNKHQIRPFHYQQRVTRVKSQALQHHVGYYLDCSSTNRHCLLQRVNCSGGVVPGNPKLFTLPSSPQGVANALLAVPYQADYKFWVINSS